VLDAMEKKDGKDRKLESSRGETQGWVVDRINRSLVVTNGHVVTVRDWTVVFRVRRFTSLRCTQDIDCICPIASNLAMSSTSTHSMSIDVDEVLFNPDNVGTVCRNRAPLCYSNLHWGSSR
jgi:hypothetical protein